MTMRAALFGDPSADLAIGEIEFPRREAGQALIEVRAASLNPFDLFVASGKAYVRRPDLPYVPGVEGVGVVLEADGVAPGTRVRFECLATSRYGSLGERTVAPAASLLPLPGDVSDLVATALGIAGWAGWLSLSWRARLAPGEKVLVLGATGVVGQIAVQAARLLGAGRVVAAGRNAAALDEARNLGADATVVLDERSPPELAAAFNEAAGGPLDVIVDPLWGAPAVAALLAAGPGGRLVNLGQGAGETAPLASPLLRSKMLSILGYVTFAVPWPDRRAAYERMLGHAARGELRVAIEAFPLERAADAWRAQKSSPHRKLVVTIP